MYYRIRYVLEIWLSALFLTLFLAGCPGDRGGNPGSCDANPPMVVSTFPVNSSINIAVAANITATFSEAMDPASISSTTMTLYQGVTPFAGIITYDSLTATLNPAGNLTGNTVYTVTITTAVRNLSGSNIVTNYVWTFTTGDVIPPTVVSTIPTNGATNVAVAANITATFSEAMAPATISTTTMTLYQGLTQITGVVSYAGLVATFNPNSDLASGTLYTATITTGATDLLVMR